MSSPKTRKLRPQKDYVVAIPTYNRVNELVGKTLITLKKGGVDPTNIYIFLANNDELQKYADAVPKDLYGKMVVGKKGIAAQRKFISMYFPVGTYVVSIDDDIQSLGKRVDDKTLSTIRNVDGFFRKAFDTISKKGLYLWGIYPTPNPYYMTDKTSVDLKFIIGCLHGFISRKDRSLFPSESAETKEDYELSILYFKKDGGVVRFNNISVKTKFNAPGGLGTDRYERNLKAAEYLEKTYPDLIRRFERKNGMPEVNLRRPPTSP